MGLEVGWYLRFAKTDRIEAMVSLAAAAQVSHAMYIHTDWTLDIEEFEDYAVAHLTRKSPRYVTEANKEDS